VRQPGAALSCSGTALPSTLAAGSEMRTWFAADEVVSTPRAGAGSRSENTVETLARAAYGLPTVTA